MGVRRGGGRDYLLAYIIVPRELPRVKDLHVVSKAHNARDVNLCINVHLICKQLICSMCASASNLRRQISYRKKETMTGKNMEERSTNVFNVHIHV